MYKIVNTITHDLFLGTEKAVIILAQDVLSDESKDWRDDHFWELKRIGCDNGITTFQGAVKFLMLEDFEVVDIGDIIDALKEDNPILISQEE